jgi:hypothetical protein
MIFFQPYGPFPVKRSDGHIDRSKEAKRAFWDMANKNKECLNVASGSARRLVPGQHLAEFALGVLLPLHLLPVE